MDCHGGLALAGCRWWNCVRARPRCRLLDPVSPPDPPLTQVELGQFAARGDARLGEDVPQVEGDGARRDPALGGDFLVGQKVTSSAIWSSVGVSLTSVEGSRLRAVSPSHAAPGWLVRDADPAHGARNQLLAEAVMLG